MSLPVPPFRRAFLTGLVVLIPVAVTFWVMWIAVRMVDGWISPWIARTPWLKDNLPQAAGTALGFLAVLLLITLVGAVANSLAGRAILGGFDRLVARLPILRGIYSATKELSGVLFADRSQAFRKVILFEYPRRGSYSLGFVTNELHSSTTPGLYNVFLPTTPNPTSGYFLMIPCEDAIQLDISVEEGLKMVVSGGAVVSQPGRELMLRHIRGAGALPRVPPGD